MIYWAPFLHFYQPSIQFHSILKKVCDESYRPLIKMLLRHPEAKVTINMCGALTEMLDAHGAKDILNNIKELAGNNQLEFTDSAKYHPILPLIPKKEIKRQAELNRQTNESFFGEVYKPRGFFPPEMCYSGKVEKTIQEIGYDWILISGIACSGVWPLDFIHRISSGVSPVSVFYRDDILSNKVSFRNLDSLGFIKELVGLARGKRDAYIITAMDAETFGHHIPHWEKIFLAEVYKKINAVKNIYQDNNAESQKKYPGAFKKIAESVEGIPDMEVVTISMLLEKFPAKEAKAPKPSSWSTAKEDIAGKNYYPLWKGAGNVIHDLQWEHLNICFELVKQALKLKGESSRFAVIARTILDKAVYSCQFWWANKGRGSWDINLINKGLILQKEVLLNACKAINISSLDEDRKKNFYYMEIAARDIANKIRNLLLK